MNYSRLIRRLLAGSILAFLSAQASHAFEGKATMTNTVGKHVFPIVYYIKGLHIRTETTISTDKAGKKMTSVGISNMETHEMDVLMPDQKMYMAFPIPDADTLMDGKSAEAFKPTGRKEKIAGYDAEEYAGVSEGKPTEMWVTKELGQFIMANMGKPGRKPSQAAQWEKFMRDGNFFLLRLIQRNKEKGPEQIHLEVDHVEKGPQADSLFQVPEDFKKLEMPDMGSVLKGLIPGH